MVKSKEKLSSGQVSLLLMQDADYNTEMIKAIRSLKGKSICYVTTNKTFDSLKEDFKSKKVSIEKTVFVDAISKSFKKVPDSADQVYYVSSPGALTELSLVIGKFLRHEFDYLVFDSLTNLVTYTKESTAIRFVKNLIDKIKKTKTKAIFYCMDIKSQEGLIKQASMSVDKTIKV
jgi:archaellum biogenesis ATPase FlaH